MKKRVRKIECTLSTSLRSRASLQTAKVLMRFFKTGPGDYGEGDRFLGVTMPEIRESVREFRDRIPQSELRALLRSPFHEERMAGLLVLVERSRRADAVEQRKIARLYLRNRKAVNSWDLVDVTVPAVLGPLLFRKEPEFVRWFQRFLGSRNLWERRIGILMTFFSIREGRFEEAVIACRSVLSDSEDLIHKASGWMLREVGKREVEVLRAFLASHSRQMPRTMLRYAIERLPLAERKRWMKSV